MQVIEKTEKPKYFEGLIAELSTLPPVPSDVHKFGSAIEDIKRTLGQATDYRSSLQESLALHKADLLSDIRADKQFTNETQRNDELKRRLAASDLAREYEHKIDELGTALLRLDARRSRLSRDYEVALIDYEFEKLGRRTRAHDTE